MPSADRSPLTKEDVEARQRLLELVPPISHDEIEALNFLAQRPIWDMRVEEPFVSLWALEQLDRRQWIEAVPVDLKKKADGTPEYVGTPPWRYSPMRANRDSGLSRWDGIRDGFLHTQETDVDRLWALVRLTKQGFAANKVLKHSDLPPLGKFDTLALAIEQLSAAWRQGDNEMLRLIWSGVPADSGLFEKIVRDKIRAPVRASCDRLRYELIPALVSQLEPSLRNELRALVRSIDPDAMVQGEYEDEGSLERWRLSWSRVGCESSAREIVALLRSLEDRRERSQDSRREWETSNREDEAPVVVPDDLKPAQWYKKITNKYLTADRLRMAANRKNLTGYRPRGTKKWFYSVQEVCKVWPNEEKRLMKAFADQKDQGREAK